MAKWACEVQGVGWNEDEGEICKQSVHLTASPGGPPLALIAYRWPTDSGGGPRIPQRACDAASGGRSSVVTRSDLRGFEDAMIGARSSHGGRPSKRSPGCAVAGDWRPCHRGHAMIARRDALGPGVAAAPTIQFALYALLAAEAVVAGCLRDRATTLFSAAARARRQHTFLFCLRAFRS